MTYKLYPHISFGPLLWPYVLVILMCFSECQQADRGKKTLIKPTAAKVLSDTNSLRVDYALGFDIEYYQGYKALHIISHYKKDKDTTSYLLLLSEELVPKGFSEWPVIRVPVKSVIMTSSTQVALLDALDAMEVLSGLSNTDFLWSKKARARVAEGKVTKVGVGESLDVERVISINPDLMIAVGFPEMNYESYATIESAGIPVIYNAEWQEKSLLGRAEWVKVMAALLSKEKEVTMLFDRVTTEYDSLKKLTAHVKDKPLVVCNIPHRGTWYVPGAESYMAKLVEDAGGDYPWNDRGNAGSIAVDFEGVYQQGLVADRWITVGNHRTMDELESVDSRFKDFRPFRLGQVYNNTKRWEIGKGNDYWEKGMVYPNYILADMIKILHPEMLPNHELFFYEKLK